jgi:hypothetical protein|tara:strand:+ start:605 stop:892 length:288 start_codon:yes stop_codon:yes gene_type:complete
MKGKIMTIQFPQININGQDGMTLLRQYDTAISAVVTAIEALQAIDVHQRDYQTLDSDAYYRARKQHRERLWALQAINNGLTAIALDIFKQTNKEG